MKSIIEFYINNTNSNEIDSESIQKLSECVSYLEQLKKSKEVERQIAAFEEQMLNQVNIIESESSSEKMDSSDIDILPNEDSVDSSEYSQEKLNYHYVNEKQWKELRYRDVVAFISILKSMPDIELVLPTKNKDGSKEYTEDANVDYLILMSDEKYISVTMNQAYSYVRDRLQNINKMERAWNYLFSNNNFLAKFCALIAVFMDIASCIIGLFLYA